MLTGDRGITLIELLIGLALGATVIAAILGLYIRFAGQGRHLVTQAGFFHELDTVIGLMARDIRRAGYWQFEEPGMAIDNPFADIDTDIQTGRYDTSEAADSCLTYSYDLNHDGRFSQGNNEYFGFRQHGQAIEMRTGGAEHGCTAGSWQKITSAAVRITIVTFAIEQHYFDPLAAMENCSSNSCQIMRRVHVTVSGYPENHPGEAMTLTAMVLVRNNRPVR